MEDVRQPIESDKQPTQPNSPPMPHVKRSGSLAVGQSTEIVSERDAGEGSADEQQEEWVPPSKAFEGTLRPQREMKLTTRQTEVIALKAMGYSAEEAGGILKISGETVTGHLTKAGDRLDIHPPIRLICAIYGVGGQLPQERRDEVGLTNREAEIVPLIAEGFTDAQIATRLELAKNTILTYISAIIAKARARNRIHAVAVLYGTAMPLSNEEWEPSNRSGVIKQE
jgi:DNA-binding NarL/FixJ family response regulator